MIHGSCLCGNVTFEYEAPTTNFVLCHCNKCKKSSGSAFVAGLEVTGLNFLSGEEQINSFEAPLELVAPRYRRDFCVNCGSPLPWQALENGNYMVPAGTLNADPGAKPQEHVWVDCEVAWEQAIETLPRLTEAEFILDRVRKLDSAGGDNMADHYRFIVARYTDNPAASDVVAAARARLADLSKT